MNLESLHGKNENSVAVQNARDSEFPKELKAYHIQYLENMGKAPALDMTEVRC